MECKYHCCQNEVIQGNSKRKKLFCNDSCKNKYCVDKRRLELKFKAHKYKGGKCEECGFKGLPASFDFHHIDPKTKSFSISSDPHTRSWEKLKEELDKCQLLCANCHREVEFKKTMDMKLFIPELIEKYCGTAGT
jgi:hypothetical protein